MSKKETYRWYKGHGICVRCHKNDALTNHTRCYECWEKEYDKQKTEKSLTEEENEKKRSQRLGYLRTVYAKRKENHICTKCKKILPQDYEKAQCPVCLRKACSAVKKMNYKNGAIPFELRGNGVYCYKCCNPNANGKKLCPECYEKQMRIIRYASQFQKPKNNYFKKSMNRFFKGELHD